MSYGRNFDDWVSVEDDWKTPKRSNESAPDSDDWVSVEDDWKTPKAGAGNNWKKQISDKVDAATSGLFKAINLGFDDEAVGGLSAVAGALSPFNKDSFADNYNKYRAEYENEQLERKKENPGTHLAGSILGSAFSPFIRISPSASLTKTAAANAIENAIEGFGNGKNLKDRLKKGAIQGAVSAPATFALAGLSNIGGRAINRLKNSDDEIQRIVKKKYGLPDDQAVDSFRENITKGAKDKLSRIKAEENKMFADAKRFVAEAPKLGDGFIMNADEVNVKPLVDKLKSIRAIAPEIPNSRLNPIIDELENGKNMSLAKMQRIKTYLGDKSENGLGALYPHDMGGAIPIAEEVMQNAVREGTAKNLGGLSYLNGVKLDKETIGQIANQKAADLKKAWENYAENRADDGAVAVLEKFADPSLANGKALSLIRESASDANKFNKVVADEGGEMPENVKNILRAYVNAPDKFKTMSKGIAKDIYGGDYKEIKNLFNHGSVKAWQDALDLLLGQNGRMGKGLNRALSKQLKNEN
jgi:hypothetical protein